MSKKQKRIFLLTDGAFDNAGKIIGVAKKKCQTVKIHTFDLGAEQNK